MAGNDRNPSALLSRRAIERAKTIEFAQLVRMLNRAYGEANQKETSDHDNNPINGILYRANPSMGFPSSDVESVNYSIHGFFEVVVNFMGLYGPASPLPSNFTEDIISETVLQDSEDGELFYLHSEDEIRRLQDKQLDTESQISKSLQTKKSVKAGTIQALRCENDFVEGIINKRPLSELLKESELDEFKQGNLVLEILLPARANRRDFLDLFNHKFIKTYLAASLKYKPHIFAEEAAVNQYKQMMYSLIGAPGKKERETSVLNWDKLLSMVGLIGIRRNAAEVIQKVVARYFSISLNSVYIEEGAPRRATIVKEQLFILGKNAHQLGVDAFIGETVPDVINKFRLHIKFSTVERYLEYCPFLPKAELFNELFALLTYLSTPNQLFDFSFHLPADGEIPLQVSYSNTCCLGYSTWLGTRESKPTSTVITL